MQCNIATLQRLCLKNKIVWKEHALQRMKERKITRRDVKNCILNGEIIEQYPDDYPYGSCLILGTSLGSYALHTVCSDNDELLCVITAYYPSGDKWESDFKTRRKAVMQ